MSPTRSASLYIAAQIVGGALALLIVRTLYPDITARQAASVVMAHECEMSTVDSRN